MTLVSLWLQRRDTLAHLQGVPLSHSVHLALLSPFFSLQDGEEQRRLLGGRHCRDKGLEAGAQAKSGRQRCWL